MTEVIIENANNKRNIDVPKLINDLTQHKKVSNDNFDENKLKMKFAEALVFLKREWFYKFELNEIEKSEPSEFLKQFICCFFSRKKKLYIEKKNWDNDESSSLFDAYEQNENHNFSDEDILINPISMREGEYWSIDYFIENQLYLHTLCPMLR